MTSKKREFDKVSHSATGRTDTSKKGGHRTWGSDKEQIEQGKNEFANQNNKGGPGNVNRGNVPENLHQLNQLGNEAEENKVSFEAFQKQQGKGRSTRPYAVNEKKGKKRNPKNRSKAEKVTDSLFGGEFKNKNKNKNNNKNEQHIDDEQMTNKNNRYERFLKNGNENINVVNRQGEEDIIEQSLSTTIGKNIVFLALFIFVFSTFSGAIILKFLHKQEESKELKRKLADDDEFAIVGQYGSVQIA